jgi:hypothetical protein
MLGNLTITKTLSNSGNSHHLYRSQGLRNNIDSSGILGEIIDKTLKLEEKALTFEKLKYSMKQKDDQILSKEKYRKVNLVKENGYQTNQEKRSKYEKGRLFRDF